VSTYISDIYLLRHGETDLNKNQLTQGVTDAPLNEAGLQQAEEAGE
jgi:broad specificity phosphatase PhoE